VHLRDVRAQYLLSSHGTRDGSRLGRGHTRRASSDGPAVGNAQSRLFAEGLTDLRRIDRRPSPPSEVPPAMLRRKSGDGLEGTGIRSVGPAYCTRLVTTATAFLRSFSIPPRSIGIVPGERLTPVETSRFSVRRSRRSRRPPHPRVSALLRSHDWETGLMRLPETTSLRGAAVRAGAGTN
jgi:hypothetical protein